MERNKWKECPQCHQKLRFPEKVGGMVMACPKCGKKFYTDFKLQGEKSGQPRELDHPAQSGFQSLLNWLYKNVFCIWFK